MQIRVLLFSILRLKTGLGQWVLALPDGATVADARHALGEAQPAIVMDLPRVAWAVNAEYVQLDHVLKDQDELAVIAPVSGG